MYYVHTVGVMLFNGSFFYDSNYLVSLVLSYVPIAKYKLNPFIFES